jgi:hypothetical protein
VFFQLSRVSADRDHAPTGIVRSDGKPVIERMPNVPRHPHPADRRLRKSVLAAAVFIAVISLLALPTLNLADRPAAPAAPNGAKQQTS